MATSVREVMTPDPVVLETTASARDAAAAMRDQHIGDVLVVDGNTFRGIVTDRDLAVRVLANGDDPDATTLGDIMTADPEVVSADASISEVIDTIRQVAVRRVPVVEDGMPIGIVSLGDLAMRFDEDSALADVSAAQPNS